MTAVSDARDQRILELEAENARLHRTGALYRTAVESAHDFAIFTTDLNGVITSWNPGAEKLLGWSDKAAVGQHARMIFTSDDLARGACEHEMSTAANKGKAEDERWHLREDGSRFWASGLMMRLEDERTAEHIGFLKVLRDHTAQHEASERAKSGEARLRLILDHAVDALYGVDRDGVTTFCNSAFLRMLGFAREQDAVGRKLHDLIHHSRPDGSHYPSLDCPIYKAAQEGKAAHIKGENFFRIDGTAFPVEYWAKPILNDGQVTGAVCTFIDRTKQRQAENDRSRLSAIAEQSLDFIGLAGLDGWPIFVNEAGRALVGLESLDDARSHQIIDYFDPADHETVMAEVLPGALAGYWEGELRFRHFRTGAIIPVFYNLFPVFAPNGEMIGFGTVTRDLREQKLREAADRLRERRLSSALAIAQLGAFDWHLETGAVELDERARAMFGFDDGERITARSIFDRINPEDSSRIQSAIASAREAGSTLDIEYGIHLPDGTSRIIHSTSELGSDRDGTERIIGVWSDVTNRRNYEAALRGLNETLERRVEDEIAERTRAEEQLRQAQKMEAVGQLTGGLAHDFNNLLAGISGSLELMQIRMQQGRLTDVDRYMTAAQGASKRAAALTHRLLAFSRRQTLDPKPTDVNRLAMGMQELIQRTVGPAIPIEVVGTADVWPSLVDPSQLENALLNLCINARDAMPDGGRITIETANKWMDERAARQHDIPKGQYLALSVTDTGAGMPPEIVARVFEPFFTTKPIGEGTGLGLSMIYGFAQQSGGQVRIYSEVGQGTTVCIYLPRHYGAVEDEEAAERSANLPRSQAGETVLIVDDEPTVRMLVTDILEDLGYAAIEAADSATGLKVLRSDVRIDLLVTDVGLPGGMNGRQMADAARTHRPDLNVLFITGYAENAILGNGTLPPGMAVLTKPFAMDNMAARIRSMIEGAREQARRH